MAYVWWAVRDSSIEEVISRVFEPAGYVADPRWVREFDLTTLERACFRVGEWTFALLRDKERGLESAFAQFPGEVIQLVQSDFDWAIVSGKRAGETVWSVYGDQEHDFLRIDGAPPRTPAVDRLLSQDETLSEVPPQIARALTGFEYESSLDECASPSRIVGLDRTRFVLDVADEPLPEIAVRPRSETTERVTFDLEVAGIEYADWQAIAQQEDRLLVIARHELLASVDASRFPPVLTPLARKQASAAIAPWGNVLRTDEDEDHNTLVCELAGTRVLPIGLPFSSLYDCGALRAVAEGVVAIPATWSDGEKVPCLISAAGDRRIVTRIPVPADRADDTETPLVASFGDGSFLLTWNGEAYRWHRGTLSHLGPLLADGDCPERVTTAADGSIVGTFSHQFLKVWPDGHCERIAGFGTPLQVTRGPGDALIIASDDEGLVKIWWPADQQVTPIPEDVFEGFEHVLYFDARRELLVSISPHQIEGIPWRVIAALPRRAV